MASPIQWTWVWVNSESWWWTGRSGMLQFMGSQRVGHDWATELNWSVSCINLKIHFLPTTSRASCWGSSMEIDVSLGVSRQNPQAASIVQHGHLGHGSPLPLKNWQWSLFQWLVYLQAGHDLGLFLAISDPVARWLAFEAVPHVDLIPRWIDGLPWPTWVILRPQGMADSISHAHCAWALDRLFSHWILSSSWAWSQLLNTPKDHI